MDLTPSIAASNYRDIFNDHESYSDFVKIMIKFLPIHPLLSSFDAITEAVPQVVVFKCAFSAFRLLEKPHEIHLRLVDDSVIVLTMEKFMEAINLRVLPSTVLYSPSTNNIFTALY